MILRTSTAVLVGSIFLSCGHSGTQTAVSDPHAALTAASSSSTPAATTAAAASPAPANPAAATSAEPTAAANDVKPAADFEEKLPSGVTFRQAAVGGPAPGPEMPKGTTVLHIGDSFAGALGIELNKVLEQSGVKSVLRFETSTYIPTWAHEKKLGDYLSQYKPDLVLISLGANELQNPEPEKRISLIHKLTERLGNRQCVWVAPVLWEGASPKLLEVIRANAAPCIYLDSNAFITHMPRARDKIHPSMDARPDWARVIARWLAYHRKPTVEQPWALSE
jgi:lysophospholipase L1-like esterase